MHVRRLFLLGFAAAVLAGAPAASASPPLPGSIAGIGDSITRATDVCCWYGDHPAQSWSTGDDPSDAISSHYERLLALNPEISGHNYNDSRAGAKMRDAEGQAQTAVAQQAAYVTILMGANDVCASSPSAMTSVADYRAQFTSAMNTLAAGLPAGAHVFVSSIPNVYQLWKLLHDNSNARYIWWAARICQSMLSPYNTELDRLFVLAREQAFNQVLADVCSQYAICRFDGGAVFNHQFRTSNVSTLDYFHPSISGQAMLATVTWERSWWAS